MLTRIVRISLFLLLTGLAWTPGAMAESTLRVGVLQFGTVNWTLDVMREHGFDRAQGLNIEVVGLANKDATAVALQGGAVDLIVTDWIWVSRMRAQRRNYTFVPYSITVGAVMVHPDSGIGSIGDLAGKRLGVAGGPVDKSWLLLRAYSRKTLDRDIGELVNLNFAAPPLLNELVTRGDLDAVLNFWNYNAQLRAHGLVGLIEVNDLLPALGVDAEVPLLGWVFDEQWATANRDTLLAFLHAAQQAQQLMRDSDELWTGLLRPLTRARDEATLLALRDGFRAGVPERFGSAEIDAATRVFEILADVGGTELTGRSRTLSEGTFWPGYTLSRNGD